MRKILFSVCAALAVLGCGGDMDELPPCLTCVLCGSRTLSWNEFCSEGTVYPRCGGSGYNLSTQGCCNNNIYSIETEFCSDRTVYSKCGGRDYNPSTEFCSGNSVYQASGKGNNISSYRTVVIGTQTWMAENLDYVVEGSKCYDNKVANCNTYGRLYDWATAMALPSSCNSNTCSSQVQTKHKGICPSGWHIPSNAEWTTLTTYVGSSAGTKLKAASGWNDYQGASGNGTDEFGFSALPGGHGYSGGDFGNVGNLGYWWSATDYNANYAYGRDMFYSYDDVDDNGINKSGLFSVRCLQD